MYIPLNNLYNCLEDDLMPAVKSIRVDNFKFKSTPGYWIINNQDAVTSMLIYLNNIHYTLCLINCFLCI